MKISPREVAKDKIIIKRLKQRTAKPYFIYKIFLEILPINNASHKQDTLEFMFTALRPQNVVVKKQNNNTKK